MTPDQLVKMALQQAQGDVQKAMHLLAEEVCAQMQTGFYRPLPKAPILPIKKDPEPL